MVFMAKSPRITRIMVNPDVVHNELTQRILNQSDIPFEISGTLPEVQLRSGKRILFLTNSPGRLVKPCPATKPPYLCCRYTVIHSSTQCPMDCTYCILQNYLESSVIRVNVRLNDIFREIDSLMSREPARFFRFGTGELGDSLALDPITGLSGDFLSFFASKRNGLIELKTKSTHIERVLGYPAKHAVISWSLNPDTVINLEEIHTPALQARLRSAYRCQQAGYLLGFHFDPILSVRNAKLLYEETIDQLFAVIRPERIAWISLGTLRFPPALKQVIRTRFPRSRIIYEEMIRGLDGKMRYPKPLRVELYRAVYQRLRHYSSDVFIYFCMESPRVWEEVMGKAPKHNAELDFRFAENLWRRFRGELDMNEPRQEYYLSEGK
jgi:spore photoproduct lyase